MAIKVKTHKFVDIDPVDAILSIRDDVLRGFIVENGTVFERSSGPIKQMTECTWLPEERINQLVTMHNGIQALLDWYRSN